MMSFERIKQRKLFQWAAAYLAGAWLLVQVLDLLRESFGWSTLVQQIAIVLLAVGFLAALIIAWYHGEKGAQKVTGMEILMLAGILVIAGTGVAFVGGGTDRRGAVAADQGEAPPSEQGSIAVLPFVNMSSDEEQEYFSDGLTEELLNVLAQLPELRVASRTSSFAFKGKDVPIDSVARALRVAHVLEGSVRKDEGRIRITAQLIKADDGYHVWSETYDREISSVFAVQDEISRAIVEALQVRLGGGRAEAPLAGQETSDPEAHALVLRGRHATRQNTRESYAQAIELFRQALDRDPAYAQAYVGLARAYRMQGTRGYLPAADAQASVRQAVERALALDPELADAHLALGDIAAEYDWDFERAERQVQKAIRLNPGFVEAYSQASWLLSVLGRHEEAIASARRATELDPVSAGAANGLAVAYSFAGRHAEAVEAYKAALALSPDHPILLSNLVFDYADLGAHADAIATAEKALAQARDEQFALSSAGYAYARAGRRADALSTLRALEGLPNADPYRIAIVHAALGNRDRAFELLQEAVARRSAHVRFLGVDPGFAPLRDDPRMKPLLRQIGLR